MVAAGRTPHLTILLDKVIPAVGQEGPELSDDTSSRLCIDHRPSRWTSRLGTQPIDRLKRVE